MKRLATLLAAAALAALLAAPAAEAEFGLEDFSSGFFDKNGAAATQAGSHPFAATTSFAVNTREDPVLGKVPDGAVKTARFQLPAGFIGSRTAVPTCTTAEFLTIDGGSHPACPDATAVGFTRVEVAKPGIVYAEAVYNLVAPPGVAAKIGFVVNGGIPVTVEVGLNQSPPTTSAPPR